MFSYVADVGESLSVVIQEEISQRNLLKSDHRQWSPQMSATYENQASEKRKTRCRHCWGHDGSYSTFPQFSHF